MTEQVQEKGTFGFYVKTEGGQDELVKSYKIDDYIPLTINSLKEIYIDGKTPEILKYNLPNNLALSLLDDFDDHVDNLQSKTAMEFVQSAFSHSGKNLTLPIINPNIGITEKEIPFKNNIAYYEGTIDLNQVGLVGEDNASAFFWRVADYGQGFLDIFENTIADNNFNANPRTRIIVSEMTNGIAYDLSNWRLQDQSSAISPFKLPGNLGVQLFNSVGSKDDPDNPKEKIIFGTGSSLYVYLNNVINNLQNYDMNDRISLITWNYIKPEFETIKSVTTSEIPTDDANVFLAGSTTLENNSGSDQIQTIRFNQEITDSLTLTQTKQLHFGAGVEMGYQTKVGKGIVAGTFNLNLSFKVDNTRTESKQSTTTTKRNIAIEVPVNVAKGEKVKATFLVKKSEVNVKIATDAIRYYTNQLVGTKPSEEYPGLYERTDILEATITGNTYLDTEIVYETIPATKS